MMRRCASGWSSRTRRSVAIPRASSPSRRRRRISGTRIWSRTTTSSAPNRAAGPHGGRAHTPIAIRSTSRSCCSVSWRRSKKLELAFGIVILPQRQTVLVAKQAATLDVLSRGRVRLGVAIGWNHVEYEALGMNWRDRAKRIEEQMEVLRLLWTQELVDYTGRWHRIDRAGIKPLPVQRPIPLWMGADEEVAVKRVARLADGWFSHLEPTEEGRAALERFREYVRDAGRDPARVGVEGRVGATGAPEEWARKAQIFRDMGMTHLEFRTGGSKLPDLDAHIDAMRRFREIAPVFD